MKVKGTLFYFIFIIISKIIISQPSCQENQNYCSLCHPVTKLCVKCEKDIFSPNENGGCSYAKKCIEGNHHCLECDEEGKICKKCEDSYYPDDNGCCSYSNNCELSYEGRCIKCKEDFVLIGRTDYYSTNDEIKICKSLNSEDLKNCEKIDIEKGICQECKKGYYLSTDDRKCTVTEKCFESTFGICQRCSQGYYLDKKEQKCLKQEGVFEHCKESIDSRTCDVCDEDYYFDGEGVCGGTNYCEERGEYNRCKKCINGYYLSSYGDCCTREKECYYGNKDLGVCMQCNDDYCLDYKDGKCKSNQEDNDLKYCKQANGLCTSCEYGYELSKDGKCSSTKHCSESDLGLCSVCEDDYHLGLDKRCTKVEHCIYSNQYEECIECGNGYYLNKNQRNCKAAEGNFEHCRTGYEGSNCDKCQNDYYLSGKDHLCHDNTELGPFYKCAFSDSWDERCIGCIDDYYLGYIDDKCSAIEGCDLSENENKCLECDEYYCLNLKNNRCYPNDEILSEKEKFYYNCNRTNQEGTKCEICLEGYVLNENGLCIDEEHCNSKIGGVCKSCQNTDDNYCLNNDFGCIFTFDAHCLECNQVLDFANCTKCESGYAINEYSVCEYEN